MADKQEQHKNAQEDRKRRFEGVRLLCMETVCVNKYIKLHLGEGVRKWRKKGEVENW